MKKGLEWRPWAYCASGGERCIQPDVQINLSYSRSGTSNTVKSHPLILAHSTKHRMQHPAADLARSGQIRPVHPRLACVQHHRMFVCREMEMIYRLLSMAWLLDVGSTYSQREIGVLLLERVMLDRHGIILARVPADYAQPRYLGHRREQTRSCPVLSLSPVFHPSFPPPGSPSPPHR